MKNIFDYSETKKRLFVWLTSIENATSHNCVYQVIGDMALTVKIIIETKGDLKATTYVTPEMIDSFGIDQKTLFEDANKSTLDIDSPKLESLEYVIKAPSKTDTFVFTSAKNIAGTGIFFVPSVQRDVAAMLGNDIVVVPSSSYELIMTTNKDLVTVLRECLESNNRMLTPENIFLSNHLYVFDHEKHNMTAF